MKTFEASIYKSTQLIVKFLMPYITVYFSAYIDQNVSLKDRNQIEELMIKGDLIELHLEETTDLWNLLSMFFCKYSAKIYISLQFFRSCCPSVI